jgi:hypothetical protein
MASKGEEKLPPRRFVNSAFYRRVQPWKQHTAPMQKDIHPKFWDDLKRGYEPVTLDKIPEGWQSLIESRMRPYSHKTHLFCWIKPGKDRKLPQKDDKVNVQTKDGTITKFTVEESQGSSQPPYHRSRNTGFVILKLLPAS